MIIVSFILKIIFALNALILFEISKIFALKYSYRLIFIVTSNQRVGVIDPIKIFDLNGNITKILKYLF